MTTLPQDPTLAVVASPRSSNIPLYRGEVKVSKKAASLDSIELAETEGSKSKGFIPQSRPQLPPADPKNPEYLMLLGEAFGEAFDSMSGSVVEETRDYASLQSLDQTMSQCVLKNTEDTVAKEINDMNTEKNIKAYEEKVATRDQIIGDVFMAIGIVMMVITVASMIFDAGASAAALPEEAEALEMTTISDASEDLESTSDTAEMSDTTDSTEGGESSSNTTENTQSEQSGQNTTRDIESSNSKTAQQKLDSLRQLSKVKENLKWAGKKLFGIGLGAAFGAPNLIRGLSQEVISQQLTDLANLQQDLGSAMAVMQQNNSYFQFYQQLVQRFGNVIQEETSNASEVIETFSDIVGTYRQIPYGLANAV